VPLCLGFSPSLLAHGAAVMRLAERIVPRFDLERLDGVDGLLPLLAFLGIRDATSVELQHQLRVCFRFGLCVTADPQTWWDAFRYVIASLIRWDAFRYAVSLGHPNGLSELLPAGAAVALPVADGRVVSSRDVTRLHVALPCLLGVRRVTRLHVALPCMFGVRRVTRLHVALPCLLGVRRVTRLHVALPCMLGVRRKHSGGTKHTS